MMNEKLLNKMGLKLGVTAMEKMASSPQLQARVKMAMVSALSYIAALDSSESEEEAETIAMGLSQNETACNAAQIAAMLMLCPQELDTLSAVSEVEYGDVTWQ